MTHSYAAHVAQQMAVSDAQVVELIKSYNPENLHEKQAHIVNKMKQVSGVRR